MGKYFGGIGLAVRIADKDKGAAALVGLEEAAHAPSPPLSSMT